MKISFKALKDAFPRRNFDYLSNYAVVKELVNTKTQDEHITDMMKGIQTLHDIGIAITDCVPQNYKGSKLVDLGQAWIHPYGDSLRLDHEAETSYNLMDIQEWKSAGITKFAED